MSDWTLHHDRWQGLTRLLSRADVGNCDTFSPHEQDWIVEDEKGTLVVNLYGGPGTGKSTTAALVFAYLKQRGYTAELVTEFAKDLVWEERGKTLLDQIYVFGKQNHRIARLLGSVDVIVTDSPVLLTLIYNRDSEALDKLAVDVHNRMNALDVFLTRNESVHPYNPRGRYQTPDEAKELDTRIRQLLMSLGVRFRTVDIGINAAEQIMRLVVERLNQGPHNQRCRI